MRRNNSMGTFLLGIGIGAAAGVIVNRMLDQNKVLHEQVQDTNNSPLDRQQIAQFAEQILQTDQNTINNV